MNRRTHDSMIGALVADALCMPVHWYYNTSALDQDYPGLDRYEAPGNPHPDSILWRSKYTPRNKDADILHDQAAYWGQRGVHYHQFLPAGGNTLNFRLGIELYRLVTEAGAYNARDWLDRYVECMRTSGWHRDTYVEEYHRAFFDNRASGIDLENCGITDIHIGGLTPVPFLLAALDLITSSSPGESPSGGRRPSRLDSTVQSHLALTHLGKPIALAGSAFAEILIAVSDGASLRDAIAEHGGGFVDRAQLETWSTFDDRMVVGRHLTTACYLPESFVASLYFAWKYHDDFSAGIIANARCGGDNAHRGAVVGALLAAANGVPDRWLVGLKALDELSFAEGPN